MDIHKKLNIPEGLHGLPLVKKAVKELRFQIWLRDTMNPPIKPEARKYHENIEEILKFTDEVLEIIDSEMARDERIRRTQELFKEENNAGL